MNATERQDELLLRIAEADDAADGVFQTSAAQTGTKLLHPGFPDTGQILIPGLSVISGLAGRGLVQITGYRDREMDFILTPAGRDLVERLRGGGQTEAEAQCERAERAEAALRGYRTEIEGADAERQRARERLAGKIAWLVAIPLALLVGYALSVAVGSTNTTVSAGAALLLAAGVSGLLVAGPVRRAVVRPIARLLRAVHDRT